MRATVSHNKSRQQVKDSVDNGMDQVFNGFGGALTLSDREKKWNGDTMEFSMRAKVAFIESPIKGSVEVRDNDVVIDLDLGMLKMLVPEEKVKSVVEARVRGLLDAPSPAGKS